MMKRSALCLALLLIVAAFVWGLPQAADASRGDAPKTVVLGFDGADANLTKRWIDEGQLPNLAELAQEGTFAPLRVTIPSQTPVSWSTFSTGLNPGRHTIIDFLRRDPKTYQPSFGFIAEGTKDFLWGANTPMMLSGIALVLLFLLSWGLLRLFKVRNAAALVLALVVGGAAAYGTHSSAVKLLPKQVPDVQNFQQGTTFWRALGDAGYKVKVVRMPVTFPPKPFEHGELLTGLGTPDLSGRIGKPFYFTSELFFTPRNGGDFSIEIVELYDNRGRLPTEIKGPPNKLFPDSEEKYINIPMVLDVAEDKSRLDIEVSGQNLSLNPGDWSDWVSFDFPFNELISVQGIGRFRLLSLEPEVRLYLTPIQLDPTSLPPIVDISTPRSFAPKLAERFGLFKTIGWGIDTWSLTDGTIDEEVFMEDVAKTREHYEKMLYGLLEEEEDDWDVLVFYFEFTDRVQHMMWRFFDEQHPLYDAEQAALWGPTILESYQHLDRIVGETLERKPEGAELFVASDHGFASFRRAMNYNTWLVKNGYMTLKGQETGRKTLEDLFDEGEFLTNVDWSQTKAYALGLGHIYINLEGRESEGIVKPEEYDTVVAEIKTGLEAFVDPETGENPVAYVYTRDEAFGVYDPNHVSDMVPSNNDGYRVGWQDSLGGFGQEIVEDNTRIWSGDHCSVYPPLVPGILFSTLQLKKDDPYMADIMPTLLARYGVELPDVLDGENLLP
ncbi:MAG: alkaline phosphatase family protein [Acidobacteriota bacterium]